MSEDVRRLIGVIDLASGRSVRASGGTRESYLPTRQFRFEDGGNTIIDGDAGKLLNCYRTAGLGGIYLADLDALTNGSVQRAAIKQLLECHDVSQYFLLDAGIDLVDASELRWLIQLAGDYDQLKLIVATECATSVDTYRRLADQVGYDRLWISFDYKNQRWLSTQTAERDWIGVCEARPPNAAIALDLGRVGKPTRDEEDVVNPSGSHSACEWTRRMRSIIPESIPLVSGGGVRSWSDAQGRFASGAERLLVASWFTAGE